MKRALFLILFFAVPAHAKEKWTVDDVLFSESATGFDLAPDGKWAIWVKSVMDKEKGERVQNLMRTDLTEGEDIELTRGSESCYSARWSPDGKHIAFLSARPGPKSSDKRIPMLRADADKDEAKTQLWLIKPFGGEPWRLTDFPRSVSGFNWAGDDNLIFFAQEEPTIHEKTVKDEKKDTSNIVEDEKHEPPIRLFRVELKSKKITRLTENSDRIDMLAVSPDGKWAVTRHQRSLRYEYDARIKPIMFLQNLAERTSKPIFTDKKLNISAVRWRLDSKGVYATNEFNNHPEISYPAVTQVYHYDLAVGSPKRLDLQWENGLTVQDSNAYEPGLVVTKDGFIALLANGARNKFARYTRNGDAWKRDWLEGEHAPNIFGHALSKDGKTLVYVHSTASTPTQWYSAPLDGNRIGEGTEIAEVNEKFNERTIAKTEVIRWKGALDEEVEGILYYPHEHQIGKKYPLVVMIHGGPAAADLDNWEESWAYAANLFCQRGAFVLKPNYHGSGSYGLKWMESIANGNYYDLEVPDIEKGVDHLIDKGLVDKDKLGVLGWSNGAILTIELTVRTTRYKVAVAGAGDVDWVSDWANCDFGDSFDRFYLGKSVLEDPQLYIRKSPFYKLDKVQTPTLIMFGTEDRAVATQQGWMHYRALQQLGKTDVRFILFPGEKHSPKKLVHQRRKLQEELDWFDKYLFKTTKEKNEAIKEDSPLARLEKLQSAKRDQMLYGIAFKERLIPETVEHSHLQIGRFEVTRAQMQSLFAKYPTGRGTENYPATDITFEQAQQYCDRLSELTGDKYRLPTEAEGEELYGTIETGENTLDHWAGYAVNPDDAKRLREQLEGLHRKSLLFEMTGTKAPLLREVGQFRAAGEEGVFDLGGNVAEWVTTKDGKGKLMGGSADRPADVKSPESKAAPEYRGFRVVKEAKK